jgi:cytochrome c peroxidase
VLALVASLAAGSGCDSGGTDQRDLVDEAALDDSLAAVLTRHGERRLENFMLPDDGDLASIPQDPLNPITPEKVALGALLFHDPALATTPRHPAGAGTYSCSTCHHAGAGFQAGRIQAIAEGGSGWGASGEGRRADPSYSVEDIDAQGVRSPSVVNSAYQQAMMWDGRMGSKGPNAPTSARWIPGTLEGVNLLGYEGVESQAIAALTDHRSDSVAAWPVASHPTYSALWEAAFPGEAVSRELAGLAIAAYERTLLASRAPFQLWLRGDTRAMTVDEKRGALVFFAKAGCDECHSGPALNSMAFYAVAMPDMPASAMVRPLSPSLGRGGFNGVDDDLFKFKVPQLYNLADSPFYGHGGTFQTLRSVVEYYNDGEPAVVLPPGRLEPRFVPLELTEEEVDQLTAFLEGALNDPDLERFVPASVPSGGCFPANDPAARLDIGC